MLMVVMMMINIGHYMTRTLGLGLTVEATPEATHFVKSSAHTAVH